MLVNFKERKKEASHDQEENQTQEQPNYSVNSALRSISSQGRRRSSFLRNQNLFMQNSDRDEKIDAILQLNLGLQSLQVELVEMIENVGKNFFEMNQNIQQENANISARFDALEELITDASFSEKKSSINTKEKSDEIIPNLSANTHKRARKGIRLAMPDNYKMSKVTKADDIINLIFKAIKTNFLFRSCSNDELKRINDAFDKESFTANSIIINQGEVPDRFYVIESGTVDEYIDGEKIASVGKNGTFGDFALLFGSVSASTFRAKDDCKLWYILRKDFLHITKYYRRKRLELKINILRKVKVGENVLSDVLDESELDTLALATGTKYYKAGESIVKEGEKGEVFYMIEEGYVDIVKESNGIDPVITLESGNFFGERALFSDELRSASCIAKSDVKCLILIRDDFVRMLGNLKDLLEKENTPSIKEDQNEKITYELSLSDLHLKELIGSGSFSTVKLCSLSESCNDFPELKEKNFALKCMRKDVLSEKNLFCCIENEKKALKQLDHPFVVQFYSEIMDENYIYFLLEAVIGVELYSVLSECIKFSEPWTRFYTASVVLALSAIHSKKIAHRDLKPENLMIDSTGYLKIIDFGFAKVVQRGKTWTICGTPDYFAPEMIRNEGHDWAVDYWGLGILIYEMITGAPPFSAATNGEVCQKILIGHIDFPPSMNNELKNLIENLCNNDQSKRLGRTKGGCETVKKHKWLDGFSWDCLLQHKIKSPYIPKISTQPVEKAQNSEKMEKIKNRKSSCLRVNKKGQKGEKLLAPNSLSRSVRFSVAELEVQKKCREEKQNGTNSEKVSNHTAIQKESVGKLNHTIRSRRESYSLGENRYENKLTEIMKTQRNIMKNSNISSSNLNKLACDPNKESEIPEKRKVVKKNLVLRKFSSAKLSINSFSQFVILSIKPESFSFSALQISHGERFLDPILFKSVDVIDQFQPSAKHSKLTMNEISQSCFPSGVSVRLIPRCAVRGAERLGLLREKKNFYQLHVFTDEDGIKFYGISVTTKEIMSEKETNNHIEKLRILRKMRRAALIINTRITKFFKSKASDNNMRRLIRKNLSFTDQANRKLGGPMISIRRLSDPVILERSMSKRRYHKSGSTISSTESLIELVPEISSKRCISSSVKKKSKESYINMLQGEKSGDICIVEKCYVLVGIRKDQLSLLLCALKDLVIVNQQHNISLYDNSFSEKAKDSAKRRLSRITQSIAKVETEQKTRHEILKIIASDFILSPEELKVSYPQNEMEHVREKTIRLKRKALHKTLPNIELPLPLPNLFEEFGVLALLLSFKSTGFLSILQLLLLERSILLVGTNAAEISSCAGALVELIKPFSWCSALMPLLPYSLIDFIGSPVPFICGICIEKVSDFTNLKRDVRVINAMSEGMSILNLDSGQISFTTEAGIREMVQNTHGTIHQRVACYEQRLNQLSTMKNSSMKSFELFFQNGATRNESVTILSLKRNLFHYFSSLFKTLSEDPEELKKYGELRDDGKFEFYPQRLTKPFQLHSQFQEMMTHTQLFIGFVESVTDTYFSLTENKSEAIFIADWLSFRYRYSLKKKNLLFISSYGLRNWPNQSTDNLSSFLNWHP